MEHCEISLLHGQDLGMTPCFRVAKAKTEIGPFPQGWLVFTSVNGYPVAWARPGTKVSCYTLGVKGLFNVVIRLCRRPRSPVNTVRCFFFFFLANGSAAYVKESRRILLVLTSIVLTYITAYAGNPHLESWFGYFLLSIQPDP